MTILAANGIGTPRLLQLSGDSPDGLANSSGLVGKRLMMHPFGTVVGVFDEDFRAWQGPWGQFIHSLEFYETDESRGFVRGAKWGLQPTGGPFSMTSAYPWGAENEIWGPGFQDAVRGRLGHSTMWGIIAEDLPEESNRVVSTASTATRTASRARRSSTSCRRTRAGWSSSTRRGRRSRCSRRARATWSSRRSSAPPAGTCSGTAVMGDDPATSVVDAQGRAHDVPNLYVFDGSVWPTSAGMNPTATIAALALRFTEQLIASRREQKVAA